VDILPTLQPSNLPKPSYNNSDILSMVMHVHTKLMNTFGNWLITETII